LIGWFFLIPSILIGFIRSKAWVISILLLFGASAIVQTPFLRSVELGSITIYPSDVIIVIGLIAIIFKIKHHKIKISITSLIYLSIVFVYVLISFQKDVPMSNIWNVCRVMVYPPLIGILLVAHNLNKIEIVKSSIIRIGLLSSLLNIFIFIMSYVGFPTEPWGTYGTVYGIYFIRNTSQALILTAFMLFIYTKNIWNGVRYITVFFIFIMGITVQFARNSFVAIILSVLLTFIVKIIEGSNRIQIVKGIGKFITSSILIIFLFLSIPIQFQTVILDRFDSMSAIAGDYSEDLSFNWRVIEASYAIESWRESPLIGIGAGADYRPSLGSIERASLHSEGVLTNYIHNAYLWILVDFGLLGLLLLS